MPANGTVGDPQDVICIVLSTSGLDPNSVTNSWTGSNGVITNDDRVTINATVDNNIYTTILHFDHLLESDEGVYTCNVIISDHTVSVCANFTHFISKLLCSKHAYVCVDTYSIVYASYVRKCILCSIYV